jgi:hypothetical protein
MYARCCEAEPGQEDIVEWSILWHGMKDRWVDEQIGYIMYQHDKWYLEQDKPVYHSQLLNKCSIVMFAACIKV